jgi:hypothetical protein
MATGDPAAAGDFDPASLANVFGDGATDSDANALAALIGALDPDTAGTAAGSVRL